MADVCISRQQADVHRFSEAAAILLGAPLLVWVATRDRPLNSTEKMAIGAFAVATLLIDGYLWYQYRNL